MNKQLILSNILDMFIGTKETIDYRRKLCLLATYVIHNDREDIFVTGSIGEGFLMKGSDLDMMMIFRDVIVMYPELYTHIHDMNFDQTVFFLRKVNCRPGYVNLELAKKGTRIHRLINDARFGWKDRIFISSDKLRGDFAGSMSKEFGKASSDKGPCRSHKIEEYGLKIDDAPSFACLNWPEEATEWISRTRLYGWPAPDLINRIVEDGCHVVPVGDKCCKDKFSQWRLSFATAEKQLVHSLNHSQMKVYGLLKYLLRQIESLVQTLIGEDDILCSYFLKTIIFYAVENSPASMWQEHLTFTCFGFCLNTLIDWVKASYCPQYFLPANNLFLRKVHGVNREKLLQFLHSLRDVKWDCLSVGIFFQPTIGAVLQSLDKCEIPYSNDVYLNRKRLECERDFQMFFLLKVILFSPHMKLHFEMNRVMSLLTRSQTDEYDNLIFYAMASILVKKAMNTYFLLVKYGNNRQKYKYLRICQHLLTPMASLNASPGKLTMATFFYLRGNYKRSICLCSQMTSSFKLFPVGDLNEDEKDYYHNNYCGQGYSLFKKMEDVVFEVIMTKQFCPPEIVLEVEKQPFVLPLHIPPLPYAVFLSFLCYHHIGNTKRRDELLGDLLTLCRSGEKQSGKKYWIVYSLLGISYQTVGNYRMAIEAFEDSLKVSKYCNPAEDRMVVCYENLKKSLNLKFTC